MEIQAGALCQLIRVWPRENFSAIDVRCLPSADSQVSHTLHQASSRERIPRLSPARVSGCPGVRAGFLEYARLAFGGIATRAGLPAIQRSKLGAAWLREAKPDLARAFSPLLQYAGACPYNPCLTSIVLKCLLDGSRLRPRKLSAQKFADGDHFERESGDGWTRPPVCF